MQFSDGVALALSFDRVSDFSEDAKGSPNPEYGDRHLEPKKHKDTKLLSDD